MSFWDELRYRARRLRPRRTEAELDEEIRAHLELETEEKIAAGLPPDEARQAALRRFGNVALTKEDTRAMWGLGLVEILWSDLRHGARVLRQRPGFAATAVLSLSLGIGACTAMFSVVDGVLLRALPYPEPDRIVELREVSARGASMPVAEPNFLDVHARARGLESLAEYNSNIMTVTGGVLPVRVLTQFVSKDFFKVLGVSPTLGRAFLPEESKLGGGFVAVVGHGFWQRSLGGRTELAGVTLTIEDHAYTVVGVMPPGFAFPERAEVWLPRELFPADWSRTRFYAYYTSKNDALAALVRRMAAVRRPAYDHPESWFVGRSPGVRPRDALRKTIEMTTDLSWPHRFVLREACDLWTAVPEVRDAWLNVIDVATTRHETRHGRRRHGSPVAWEPAPSPNDVRRCRYRPWAELLRRTLGVDNPSDVNERPDLIRS